jgi:hypothetical protein
VRLAKKPGVDYTQPYTKELLWMAPYLILVLVVEVGTKNPYANLKKDVVVDFTEGVVLIIRDFMLE